MINIDWDNEAEVDALLRKGLLLANAPLADLPSEPFEYSPKYKRWEKKFLADPFGYAKRKRRPMWQRSLRTAAAILLVVSIAFGALMAISPDVRAAVIRWFAEAFVTHDAYRFTERMQPQSQRSWYPGYLPEGYTVVEDEEGFLRYENDNKDAITLTYQTMSEGETIQVNNEMVEITESLINGNPAFVYKALASGAKNSVVWIDESSNMAFLLSSIEQCEILVQVAESIKPDS